MYSLNTYVFLNQGYHSTEIASKTDLRESEHNDDAMTLSEALAKINAKEELVKQHIKVAEEAVSGPFWRSLEAGLPPVNQCTFADSVLDYQVQ
ncbi:hypothetical protein Tco_0344194 [Tanacetum coccineum]